MYPPYIHTNIFHTGAFIVVYLFACFICNIVQRSFTSGEKSSEGSTRPALAERRGRKSRKEGGLSQKVIEASYQTHSVTLPPFPHSPKSRGCSPFTRFCWKCCSHLLAIRRQALGSSWACKELDRTARSWERERKECKREWKKNERTGKNGVVHSWEIIDILNDSLYNNNFNNILSEF